ncbi:hypothetical protein EV182_000762, partial [Spiromyces aspiralis]
MSLVPNKSDVWSRIKVKSHHGTAIEKTCPQSRPRTKNRTYSYCLGCIVRWIIIEKRCPLCRKLVTKILYNIDSDMFDMVNAQDEQQVKRLAQNFEGLHSSTICRHSLGCNSKTAPCLGLDRRLRTWIERDLRAITNVQDVELLVHLIRGCIERDPDIFSDSLRRHLHAFLDTHTDHFLSELQQFIDSSLDIETYDRY